MGKLKLGDIYGFQYAEEKRIYNIICGKSKRKKGICLSALSLILILNGKIMYGQNMKRIIVSS